MASLALPCCASQSELCHHPCSMCKYLMQQRVCSFCDFVCQAAKPPIFATAEIEESCCRRSFHLNLVAVYRLSHTVPSVARINCSRSTYILTPVCPSIRHPALPKAQETCIRSEEPKSEAVRRHRSLKLSKTWRSEVKKQSEVKLDLVRW